MQNKQKLTQKLYQKAQLVAIGIYTAFVILLLYDRAIWWQQAKDGLAQYSDRLHYKDLALQGLKYLLLVLVVNLILYNLVRKMIRYQQNCKRRDYFLRSHIDFDGMARYIITNKIL